jgi:hypothetical protein
VISPERFYELVGIFDAWLDDNVSQEYKNQPLAQDWARVTKIGEELGEAIEELIAATGQNPRKPGRAEAKAMLLDELADCALTSIYAIQHLVKDEDLTHRIIEERLIYHCERVGLL